VRLLLDTHVLIWWDEGVRLKPGAREAIETADQVYVSPVSAWEIAIKAALGRLKPLRTVADAIADSGFEELPLRLRHFEGFERMPTHHRDPFDRALIAQALVDRLTIVTRDPVFRQYGVPLIVA
jgi:PIN domain nuclease of toxin-antitoxin system